MTTAAGHPLSVQLANLRHDTPTQQVHAIGQALRID
jgi:hypothetical protein